MSRLRFLADECVSRSIVEHLRSAGHDVLFIADEHRGSDDELVLSLAVAEERLLLTEDRDFGELLFRRPASGVIGGVLIRIPPERASLRWPRLRTALETLGDRLKGRFVVIEEERTRSRPLNQLSRPETL